MSFRGKHNRGPKYGGPKLPSTLMDEVTAAYGASGRSNSVRARKDARKAARKGPPQPRNPPRQQERHEHAESSSKLKGKRRASPEPESEEEQAPKKKAKGAQGTTVLAQLVKDKAEAKQKKSKKELVLPQDDGDVEDREIEWLEYMLKKEKGGDGDLSDGLDDILEFTGKMQKGQLKRDDLQLDSDSELEGFEEWHGIDSDAEVDLSESDEDDNDEGGSEEDGESAEDEEEASDDAGEDEDVDLDESGDSSEGESDDEDEPATGVKEAADAAAAPEPATPAGRYVPPHLRAAQLGEKAATDGAKVAERIKLERKAQGLLNKLSEANMDGILADVEKLFGEFSRNDVTTTLTKQIIDMIGSKTNLLDSFVVLYATLIGALHRAVGLEFGAHFVQTLVKKYHELAQQTAPTAEEASENQNDPSREAFNLLTLISELYNAGVIGAGLIYDLIRGFIGASGDGMSERGVEGLMKIVKCAGSQLRADDPASLKDIVTLVQEQTRGKEKEMTTRAKFMVETLVALRGGKTKGLGAEREDVARMRRFLGGMGKKRRLLAPEPLRVGLNDLLSADSRGKWWLVGAGWSGNPLVERATSLSFDTKKKQTKTTAEAEDEEVLLDLARKQGMNTDVRRSVFVVLLTSEDYVHACDRLNAFRLTNVQEREFVRVALHCCGMEGQYNPYYTLVLNNLCDNSYDHRFTLQYALWDLLRELGEGTVKADRISNVAKSLAYLMARGSVDVTILKGADFTDLSKQTRQFLDQLMRNLMIAIQGSSPLLTLPKGFKAKEIDIEAVEETFDKALAVPELAGGLAYVLQGVKKTPGKGVGELEAGVIEQSAEAAVEVLAKAI